MTERAASDGPPPVAAPSSRVHAELERSRWIARVLDDLVAVPGTRWRVGLDPLLGLIPFAGDWVGWAASIQLMIAGARLGAPPATLVRMAANLGVDALVGSVPLLGDLFDAGFKANRRNLALLERHAVDPSSTERSSRWVLGSILAVTLVVLAGAAFAAVLMLRWLWRLLAGL